MSVTSLETLQGWAGDNTRNDFQPAIGFVVSGLGSKVHDICGRDWVERGGDHGDPGEFYAVLTTLLSSSW